MTTQRPTKLSRRVERVAGYPPLAEMGDLQQPELHEALLHADSFEDCWGRRTIVG